MSDSFLFLTQEAVVMTHCRYNRAPLQNMSLEEFDVESLANQGCSCRTQDILAIYWFAEDFSALKETHFDDITRRASQQPLVGKSR